MPVAKFKVQVSAFQSALQGMQEALHLLKGSVHSCLHSFVNFFLPPTALHAISQAILLLWHFCWHGNTSSSSRHGGGGGGSFGDGSGGGEEFFSTGGAGGGGEGGGDSLQKAASS